MSNEKTALVKQGEVRLAVAELSEEEQASLAVEIIKTLPRSTVFDIMRSMVRDFGVQLESESHIPIGGVAPIAIYNSVLSDDDRERLDALSMKEISEGKFEPEI